jgi:hypothetical protein
MLASKDYIEFDPYGNLWLCAYKGFFKWNGEFFEKYSIEDSLTDKRQYRTMCFDSIGNSWLTAVCLLKDTIINNIHYIEELNQLIKYRSKNYTIVDQTISAYNYGDDFGLMTLKDGRVLVHKMVLSCPDETNLFIYDNDGIDTSLFIRSPHNIISQEYNIASSYINKIIEDHNKNIWFSLDYNSDCNEPGLVQWKKDGSWKTYSKEDGMRALFYKNFNNLGFDTVYSPCYGMAQDVSGNIWVGGSNLLNIINNNILIPPDSTSFFNNLTFYAREFPSETYYDEYRNYQIDSLFYLIQNLFKKDIYYPSSHFQNKVTDITITSDGNIWFSLLGLGILRYSPNSTDVKIQCKNYEEIEIYPQPISTDNKQFFISFKNTITYPIKIKIYDLWGREYNCDIQKNNEDFNSATVIFNENSISPGAYFINVYLNEKVINKKIIIY